MNILWRVCSNQNTVMSLEQADSPRVIYKTFLKVARTQAL